MFSKAKSISRDSPFKGTARLNHKVTNAKIPLITDLLLHLASPIISQTSQILCKCWNRIYLFRDWQREFRLRLGQCFSEFFLSLIQTAPQPIGRTNLSGLPSAIRPMQFLETIAFTLTVYISFCTIWSKSAHDSDGSMPKMVIRFKYGNYYLCTVSSLLWSGYNRYTTHCIMYIVHRQIQFVCMDRH